MAVSAKDVVAKFAPNANVAYRKAFEDGDAMLAGFGITTPLRLAHFMAQCIHETGQFKILIENGRYSAKNLGQMWDGGNWHRYFADRNACVAMGDQCAKDNGVALFSLVYGGRMGNGAAKTHDGWTYRGRGVLQTTGRESYREFGKACGVDFEGQPDLVIAPEHVLKPALQEWKSKNLNLAADNNDIKVITLAINGGTVGLDARKAWFAKIWPFVTGAPAVEHSREWQVQEMLQALGYKSVVADGVIGAKTRTAILDYRVKHNLPPSPGITSDLLLSLGIA
jgi:putative chitinase